MYSLFDSGNKPYSGDGKKDCQKRNYKTNQHWNPFLALGEEYGSYNSKDCNNDCSKYGHNYLLFHVNFNYDYYKIQMGEKKELL